MRINIVTLFPEFFASPLAAGLLGRAREAGILNIHLTNPRDFTTDKHRTVDDRPYGGGPGMVMLPEPLSRALQSLGHEVGKPAPPSAPRLVYLTPKGRPLTQMEARNLAQEQALTLICGRYEGIDARLEELFPLEGISLGDFVLNGGETAALALIEAVGRLLPGFMGHEESGTEESFSASLLEYPHFTRPEIFERLAVPEVLRSGDHARIQTWRRRQALAATLNIRPDLLDGVALSPAETDFLNALPRHLPGRNLYLGLVHFPVLDKEGRSVAVSLTNLDIHDIARAAKSYGIGGFHPITPLADQRALLNTLLYHWTQGPGSRSNPDRAAALGLTRPASSLEEAATAVENLCGQPPWIVGTGARSTPTISIKALRSLLQSRPVLLLLGTGQGLAPEILECCNDLLPPIRPLGRYNHLSVRSAAAIFLDRILGDWY